MSYPERAEVRSRHYVEMYHLGIFIVISTPITISHFVLKNLVAPTSGIPKRVRMSKSVKNCENFIGVYILRAKKNTRYKKKLRMP